MSRTARRRIALLIAALGIAGAVALLVLPLLVVVGCGAYGAREAFAPPAPMMTIGADGEPTALDREAYARIDENPFVQVGAQPLSTFSIDVDTASYANVRRFLNDGQRPPRDAVRIEEMINYFQYGYPEPEGGEPFSVTAEVGPCPWAQGRRLVHIGLKGRTLRASEVGPRNLVFLLDVSGSMASPRKLPLLKQAMRVLVAQLDGRDRVAIVVYAGASGLVLPSTAGSDKVRILDALNRLSAGGSTNGGAGIELAYRTAREHFDPRGVNRVILATDGDFNVGTTSEGALTRLIERERASGVFLTVLGLGTGNLQDSRMEALADRGNGNYAYIDSLAEARKVLGTEAGATLVTIAQDVKIQVEFNPQRVQSYRLIGYENRLLRAEDFDDDSKDAGEIGAGHTVTALYEVVPSGAGSKAGRTPVALRYQQERPLSAAADSSELMSVRLRHQRPGGSKSELVEGAITDRGESLGETTDDFRFSAAVAAFGMLLRSSKHAGSANWSLVAELARGARGRDPHGYRGELLEMVAKASKLVD